MGKVLTPLIPLLLLLGAMGCNVMGCIERTTATPMVQLYDSHTLQSITIDTLSVYGLGQVDGAPLLDSATTVGSFELPLPIPDRIEELAKVSFVLKYPSIKGVDAYLTNDTLTIAYRAYPYFASMDCGAMYNFVIETIDYTQHTAFSLLDSVGINQHEVNNEESIHIQLYYPAATE